MLEHKLNTLDSFKHLLFFLLDALQRLRLRQSVGQRGEGCEDLVIRRLVISREDGSLVCAGVFTNEGPRAAIHALAQLVRHLLVSWRSLRFLLPLDS